MIVVGLIVVLHPDRLTDQLDLFTSPSVKDIVYSLVIATIAYAGIEAASDLAPELEFEPADLKRVLGVGAIAIPLIYAGIAAVALMAVPVVRDRMARRPRSRAGTSRSRSWGWWRTTTRHGWPTS